MARPATHRSKDRRDYAPTVMILIALAIGLVMQCHSILDHRAEHKAGTTAHHP